MSRPTSRDLDSDSPSFRRLYTELGGPVPVRGMLHWQSFRAVCNEFPFERVVPVICKWSEFEEQQLRHWPWIAFAADQYGVERTRRHLGLRKEPKPKEVEDTLRGVCHDAKSLADRLAALRAWGNSPPSPSAPRRHEHIRQLYQFLMVYGVGAYIEPFGESAFEVFLLQEQFIHRLTNLSKGAEAAEAMLDKELIGRTRSTSDDSLYMLVSRCADIWPSLTGRPASVNKVHSVGRQDAEPDFVKFVRDIALLATGDEPTFSQIATAFRTHYREKKVPE